ncbi:hypothetical protein BH10PSE7_BH10PSE7_14680 [soil metagenome]
MIRRRAWFPLLATAYFLSVPGAVAQDADGLRPSADDIAGEEEPQVPQAIAAPPTYLTVNPPLESESPRLRRRAPDADPYAPLGVDLGGLTAFPALRLGVTATDNVAQTHSDRDSDLGFNVRPSLRVESDWVRHSFQLEGTGEFIFYKDQSDQDTKTADIRSRLKLDVRRTTDLIFEGGYALTQESASNIDVPDAATSDRTDQAADISSALTHRMGRVESTLRGSALWRFYDDVDLSGGGTEDNADRDYVEPRIAFRTGYEVSPAFRPFVEAAYDPRFHRKSVDRNGLRRDSDGYQFSAGAAFDPSPIWSGELAVTYLIRNYDDSALDDNDAVGLNGSVLWQPTEITRVRFTAITDLNETSLADSSGSREYTAKFDIAHDLRDNLTAIVGASADYEDFQGINADELILSANAGLIWRLNRSLALTADYDFTWSDSSEPSSDYNEHRVTAGIELRR